MLTPPFMSPASKVLCMNDNTYIWQYLLVWKLQTAVFECSRVLTSVTTRPALLRMKATSYEITRFRSSSRARCTTCRLTRLECIDCM